MTCSRCVLFLAVAGLSFLFTGYGRDDDEGRRVQSARSVQQDVRIDTVRLLTIGDDPNDLLHRVSGAVLVGDTLIIAQSSSLRFYDRRSGQLLHWVGRKGEGPGEYRVISSIQRLGERLFTFDYSSRRVTVYDLSGALERTVDIEYWAPYRSPNWVGVFPDPGLFMKFRVERKVGA